MLLAALLLGITVGGSMLMIAIGRPRGSLRPARAGPGPDLGPLTAPMPLSKRAPGQPVAEDAHLPRWLRASLRAERTWTPRADEVEHRPGRNGAMTFATPEAAGANRMALRYDLVTVLDRPTEAYGQTLGRLRAGDEVELLEIQADWARVRAPSGLSGWLPSMTLGAAIAPAGGGGGPDVLTADEARDARLYLAAHHHE